MSETTPKMTSTERVRRYRAKARQEGWVMVEVRVPTDRADDLRAYAKKLGKPKPKTQKLDGQMPLFDFMPDAKEPARNVSETH